MNIIKYVAIVAFVSTSPILSAVAQESSYTPGTVWTTSYIKTEPGQFENYMDWLDGQWKKIQEFSKKSGYVVSYHVLRVNNPGVGDPDLVLAIESKDYLPTAERMAFDKKIEAMLSQDSRKQESASAERKSMRMLMGSRVSQELKLK